MRLALVLTLGVLLAPAAPAADPDCLGAASRDPAAPCRNASLDWRVTPTPDEAPLVPNSSCDPGEPGTPVLCTYGDGEKEVALIGDSHAMHWRPALKDAAAELSLRVTEMATPGCAFTAARAVGAYSEHCPGFVQDVVDWLREHPQIHTIVVSANARDKIHVPRESTYRHTQVDGYLRQWDRLPASVARVVVLRDIYRDARATPGCVRKAMAASRPAGPACRVSRAKRLEPDPEQRAAARSSRGVAVLDFTPQMCSARWCFPVVGGVLVHRDGDHLTRTFAETLGPILTRGLVTWLAP